LPADWEPLRIRSSEVAFAWGPAGGGAPRELGALEVAIAAGPGGAGTVWLADLRFEDLSLAGPPRVSASSAAPDHAPAHALDPSPATSWRSAGGAPQWLARLRPRGPAHLVGAARLHAAAEWAGCPRARAGAGTASAARRLDRTPAAPPPARARGGHGVPVDDFDADGVTLGRGSHVVMRLRA
jgi:hypothetical protein